MGMFGQRRATIWAFLLFGVVVFGAGSAPVGAEDDEPATRAPPPAAGPPLFTLLGGIGNSTGGLGFEGQYYLGGGRFSLFAGVGYWPGDPDSDRYPSGVAGAGGARVFTSGRKHRGFLEVGLGPIAGTFVAVDDDEVLDRTIVYGPSAQLGYQLVKDSGFTFKASVGIGYGRWGEYDISVTSLQIGLGIGQTWR